jgi:hypothetical protein
MTTKMKTTTWETLPRSSKLAACLWPQLVDENIRREMRSLSANEGKTSPFDAKVSADKASGVRVNYQQRRK